jgi:hypothetical protein
MLKEIIAFVILSLYVSKCSAVCVTQPLIVGEITDADINDPAVIEAALNVHNIIWKNNSSFKNSEYVILGARSQIVNGIKYYFVFYYPSEDEDCDFEVTYQSWTNQYSLGSRSCSFQKILTNRNKTNSNDTNADRI